MKIGNVILAKDLMEIKKSGIYTISCKYKKNMYYIGSTINTFYLRWCQHIYSLKNGIHENSKLQRIVNKYGLDSLEFEILETVEDKKTILGIERYWIIMLDSVKSGYNLTYDTFNSWGVKKTEETLKKYFYKKVSQYDLNGNYIRTFKSMKDASKITNTDYITISNVCNGKGSRQANGFQWKFGNNKKKINPIREKSAKSIHKYNMNGEYICSFLTLKEAAKDIKRAPNSISRAVSKGRESNGFFWSFKKVDKLYFEKTKNSKQIK